MKILISDQPRSELRIGRDSRKDHDDDDDGDDDGDDDEYSLFHFLPLSYFLSLGWIHSKTRHSPNIYGNILADESCES